MKRNVYCAQVNFLFGNNCFLPYSVALLQSYAQSIPKLNEAYDFKEMFYLREPLVDIVGRMESPDVFGASCYCWNFRYSMALCREVKESYPNCLVVCGGPHVPNKSDGFFQKHPYVDLLVHSEGEYPFADVLKERLKDTPNYKEISGLSVNVAGGTVKTACRQRPTNIDDIPSPYLSGVFDNIDWDKYEYNFTQETHRGCGFQCSFCDWGSLTFAKVKKFSDDRVKREIDYFAARKANVLQNADANFMQFERDIDIVKYLVETKKKTGYPKKVRASYAKNSAERVFQGAKMLNDYGMSKGATISFQSLDEHTLETIRRKNIKLDAFEDLMKRYHKEGIATYSELIIGLPGETYDSFANGIEKLLNSGQHEGIHVYVASMLPNSEMSDPEYAKLHGIKSVTVPSIMFHCSPAKDEHQEYDEVVVGTKTLSSEDWLKTWRLAWAIMAFHCMGLTQSIAIILNKYKGISYRQFYEKLLEYTDANQNMGIGKAATEATQLFRNLSEGKSWGMHDNRFGDVVWPPEEGSFLNLASNLWGTYVELVCFLYSFGLETEFVEDLRTYQRWMSVNPYLHGKVKLECNHNFHECVQSALMGGDVELRQEKCVYEMDNQKRYKDLEEFAREAVWYSRKGGHFQQRDIRRIA